MVTIDYLKHLYSLKQKLIGSLPRSQGMGQGTKVNLNKVIQITELADMPQPMRIQLKQGQVSSC